jgi:DEAD/DEAH box helicase domain-containing protein
MDVAAFLDSLQRSSRHKGQIRHIQELPARPGVFGTLSRPLPVPLQDLLSRRGIERLYAHQVAAVESVREGRDFVVVTGTASGKTLCYHLPILETSLQSPTARALYLFPTKALAQDQFRGILELIDGDPRLQQEIVPGVYDGDTPTAQRRRIQSTANLVLSNPDMLHASILPQHPKWSRFFAELRFIVLDEVHTYRGILGANVACVLRRLCRVCQHYGSTPLFLSASATIANPGEFVGRLLDREIRVIDQDGSPRGRKFFVLWDPGADGSDSLAQRSASDDAVWLMAEAIQAGGQTLAFTRTRQAAELLHRYVQDELRQQRSPHVDAVRAYRGGYLPNERREIEQQLFAGRLSGVAATNALELGIDVGSLDVTLLVNYPGTIASTWQQAGRSGRRKTDSLSVLIAGNDPIDHYLIRNPEYFFNQSPEHAVVDPDNPYILANHLKAAAFELPLHEENADQFGTLAPTIANVLAESNELSHSHGQYFSPAGQSPALDVSLRHMSEQTFSIVLVKEKTALSAPDRLPRVAQWAREKFRSSAKIMDAPRHELDQAFEVIANVDRISAPELIYPEAVYLHNGETYFVQELDLEGKVAYVQRHEMSYYTQAVLESSVRVVQEIESKQEPEAYRLGYGDVDVRWKTVAFKKIKFQTRENVGYGTVDIPEQELPTTAFWLVPDRPLRDAMKLREMQISEGLCGLRNLAVMALPLVAMCDPRDISGVVDSKNFGQSCIILYDRYPGGLGYAEKGFQEFQSLVEICLHMISQCPCELGCPSCVGLPNLRPAIHSDPDLTRGYPIPNKDATVELLHLLAQSPALKASPSLMGVVPD